MNHPPAIEAVVSSVGRTQGVTSINHCLPIQKGCQSGIGMMLMIHPFTDRQGDNLSLFFSSFLPSFLFGSPVLFSSFSPAFLASHPFLPSSSPFLLSSFSSLLSFLNSSILQLFYCPTLLSLTCSTLHYNILFAVSERLKLHPQLPTHPVCISGSLAPP